MVKGDIALLKSRQLANVNVASLAKLGEVKGEVNLNVEENPRPLLKWKIRLK